MELNGSQKSFCFNHPASIFWLPSLIILAVLTVPVGAGLCLADDSTAEQIKAENLDLKNKNIELTQKFDDIFNDRLAILKKLQLTLDENAGLKKIKLEGSSQLNAQNKDNQVILKKLQHIINTNQDIIRKLKKELEEVARLNAQNTGLKNKNTELTRQFNDISKDRQAVLKKLQLTLDENTGLKKIKLEEAAQLNAQNTGLKNKNAELTQQINDIFNDRQAVLKKLKLTLNENADLKDQLSLRRRKNQHKQKLPDESILRMKLEDATLELMGDRNKDEGLKQQVADMRYNLGTVFQSQNKYDKAIKEFKSDLELNPDDADAHYNLALIYDKCKNDREQAIDHYTMYLKINPDVTDALKVKERLTELETEQKIWGYPNANGIGEKPDGLGRL